MGVGSSARISRTFDANASAIFLRPIIIQCPPLSLKYLCSRKSERSLKYIFSAVSALLASGPAMRRIASAERLSPTF